eukprot:1884095-Pleurochrysis_carterae.AAC.1
MRACAVDAGMCTRALWACLAVCLRLLVRARARVYAHERTCAHATARASVYATAGKRGKTLAADQRQ